MKLDSTAGDFLLTIETGKVLERKFEKRASSCEGFCCADFVCSRFACGDLFSFLSLPPFICITISEFPLIIVNEAIKENAFSK